MVGITILNEGTDAALSYTHAYAFMQAYVTGGGLGHMQMQ